MKEGIHADAFKRSFFQDGIAVIDLADLLLEKTDNDNKNDDDNSQNNNNNNSNNNSQHTIAGPIFDQFRAALPRLRSDVSLHIPPDATEAHSVTGFHPAGTHPWSARSNLYREGIVVSNHHHGANLPDKWLQPHGLDLLPLVQLLHRVANHVLQIIEKQLELPPGWFDEHLMGGGGATLQSTSQFHLKSYVWPQQPGEHDGDTPTQQSVSSARKQNDALEPPTLLPSHTDPSLISVVLLDRPGHQPGSQGLEYCTANGQWKETSHSGHDSAIVLVGGALSYMTGGYLPAPRHRVKCHSWVGHEELHQHRCAATLFVRPPGSVILCVPPSPTLTYVQLKRNWTFAEWNARISKNYRKSKPPKPQSQRDDRSKSPTHEGGVVFRDECTELALWPCPVVGREKFLGGELSTRNGKIYTIPGHAPRVMVIDAPRLEQYATPCDNDPVPSHHCNGSSSLSDMMYCIGPEFDGEYKWLRGVSMPNGLIVGIPCHAGAILCINPDTDRVFTVDWDETDPLAPSKDLPWKWHGGQVSPFDGCLYCIPQRAETVLKFDPTTLTATFLGGPFPGRNKWYGGLLGCDGAIYGVNQNHPSVLRIDPNNQITTLHGHFPDGGHKWHGGVLGPDGNIYGIPANGTKLFVSLYHCSSPILGRQHSPQDRQFVFHTCS